MRILLFAFLLASSLTACKENAGGESAQQTSGPADTAASVTDSPSPASSTPTPAATATATASVSLTGTQWVLEIVTGTSATSAGSKKATLLFDPGAPQFKGHTGCNTVFGEFKTSGNQMRFINLIPTQMGCPDPETEATIIQALNDVTGYSLKGGTLQLLNARKELLLQYTAGSR